MKLSDFEYNLPRNLIAQRPLEDRASSRLLVVDKRGGRREDRKFRELPELVRGDELVVVNNTRVIPGRLLGRRKGVRAEPVGRRGKARRDYLQAEIEVLLTRQLSPDLWEALVRPGRKMRTGERVVFGAGELEAEVLGRGEFGLRRIRLSGKGDIAETVQRLGHVPLPPYIRRADEAADRERYQTVFAKMSGAVAAPTAGLHFTPEMVRTLRAQGVEFCEITLHVGLGTIQPIRTEQIEEHRMQSEPYEISLKAAAKISAAKKHGRPVLAVGTTVVRALEHSARRSQRTAEAGRTSSNARVVMAGPGEADLFIYPGYDFQVVDQLLTNFHLPKSSLLVMVSAFAGRELILRAYEHAIEAGYRFYSYGDCMLIR